MHKPDNDRTMKKVAIPSMAASIPASVQISRTASEKIIELKANIMAVIKTIDHEINEIVLRERLALRRASE